MRIILIADTFPPLRNSGALQLRDLALEFVRLGHSLTVLLPSSNQEDSWLLENLKGVRIIRLKTPFKRDVGFVRRAIFELLMPFAMLRQFRKTTFFDEYWDGVVWYSPSIFFGPLVSCLKKKNNCKSYLIIRDIFPDWAVDLGLMRRRSLPHLFFNAIAIYQYSVADIIGVQAVSNKTYFDRWDRKSGRKLEVLQNWLGPPGKARCSINISDTTLAGRKIFLYLGNMGVAQGIDIILDLADKMTGQKEIGFLFVGRGSEASRLNSKACQRQLENILFYDEIHPDEIFDLSFQCIAGLVSLDSRHKSHNIPGKFLTYMQCGLPVLAILNSGNDLAKIIRNKKLGQVCESYQIDDLVKLTEKLLAQIKTDGDLSNRCRSLSYRDFNVEKAATKIIKALS
jgi:glycosyltransferase involved in cell wall biosynthesis